MELFNVNGVWLYDPGGTPPGYNSHTHKQVGSWYFKNPPKGLLGVYFKARDNPFNEKYPHRDHQYTLDDLLKYEIAIEEAFVFWDANVITPTNPPKIHLIAQDIYVGQSKEEAINKYLISNQITNHTKVINPYCYNTTHNTGIVIPLPTSSYNSHTIDTIYFDAGIRIMPENTPNKTYTINDLLKLSNGAKNIYLFTFNTKKYIKTITLPDNIDPYTAIRDWKRDNNLFNYPPLVKENGFITKRLDETQTSNQKLKNGDKLEGEACSKAIIVSQQFETNDTIYIVSCGNHSFVYQLLQRYNQDLTNWKNQCYFKAGTTYTAKEIREKLGRTDLTVFCLDGSGVDWFNISEASLRPTKENNFKLHYAYNTGWGWLYDTWWFYLPGTSRPFWNDGWDPGKSLWLGSSIHNNSFKFNTYVDTTPPPKKPKELE
ncbi:hypothetical protein [Candidatus Phytoplasma solani]|uniref:hypothetical protein n=1 Tax=Candidatus Phytoplasma solani TaxID=69896 RepID=UPI00358E7176